MPLALTLQTILSFLVALVFAAIHLAGDRLRFLDTVPRSRWLSAAGGVAVAYVFIHLLPELSAAQEHFRGAFGSGPLGAIERHSYLVALLGLVIFYGLERVARSSARRQEARGRGREAEPAVFWLHLGSYSLYNLLIGYLLLHREEQGLQALLFYAIAMGFHFLVNDRGLRQDHGAAYRRYGQWVLAAAPLLGWLIGVLIDIPQLLVSTLFAFLAGGVVLNVLKEELPEERESRFSAFVAGAAVYTALLLAA
ncbi:hypothetical protein [Rhodospirillaceae bacterium SYSU D60014]|uniref:hypothetical protein n=1 Tax=Virgifigura deserti TaxID=2268457 RepID=UPI000E66E8D1